MCLYIFTVFLQQYHTIVQCTLVSLQMKSKNNKQFIIIIIVMFCWAITVKDRFRIKSPHQFPPEFHSETKDKEKISESVAMMM